MRAAPASSPWRISFMRAIVSCSSPILRRNASNRFSCATWLAGSARSASRLSSMALSITARLSFRVAISTGIERGVRRAGDLLEALDRVLVVAGGHLQLGLDGFDEACAGSVARRCGGALRHPGRRRETGHRPDAKRRPRAASRPPPPSRPTRQERGAPRRGQRRRGPPARGVLFVQPAATAAHALRGKARRSSEDAVCRIRCRSVTRRRHDSHVVRCASAPARETARGNPRPGRRRRRENSWQVIASTTPAA